MQIDLGELYGAVEGMLSSIRVPSYRAGRCIVTTAYDRELASAYVLLRELSTMTSLPIEVWHRHGELTDEQKSLLSTPAPDRITVREISGDARDFTTQYGTKAGWSTKVYAIWESEWAENLWIDSDSFPIRDPEFLFDDPDYTKKGSLFWRDVFSTDRANRYHDGAPMWRVFNVSPNDGEPFETGQMVINKVRCWPELNLVKHYADRCDVYYQFGGDAETFRMAWQHFGMRRGLRPGYINYHSDPAVPYGFMPYGPFHKGPPNQYGKWGGGSVMVQRDRDGAELFNHRNLQKLTLGSNPFYADITNESRYHEGVEELRQLMDGKI